MSDSAAVVWTLVQKELRDASRSRWLGGFALTFTLLALGLSLTGSASDAQGGFSRTTAGLVNLCLLLVPLLCLVLGSSAVVSERERGTLATMLAQPVSPLEFLVGKYVGLTLAVWAAVGLGFGVAGLAIALLHPITGIVQYLLFGLLSAGLTMTMLAVGLLLSVASDARMKALALGMVTWFVLVLFYDLAAIALALTFSTSGQALLLAVLANPVEGVRILAVIELQPDLRILGPMGAYLVNELGVPTTRTILLAQLVAWTVLPLLAAWRLFEHQDYA